MEEENIQRKRLYRPIVLEGEKLLLQSLKEFFETHPEVNVAIFAGKGGLGKTTFSAATAQWMANRGKKVLCFSTDPQASLSDIFEKDLFGKGEQELANNLYVIEIDADRKISAYQEEIKQKILDMYTLDELPPEIDEYIKSAAAEPAMHESATFDAMADLVANADYDFYIFDMPPFGHGVRMISMAQILDAWIEKIEETRKKAYEYNAVAATLRGSTTEESQDAMINEITEIGKKLDLFTKFLSDPKKTAFFMVLIPERMAILDTKRALEMFGKLNLKLSGIIVNQVYPVELLQREELSDFLRNRITGQQEYLKDIWNDFRDHIRAICPMFDREPKGLEMIAKVADRVFEKPWLEGETSGE